MVELGEITGVAKGAFIGFGDTLQWILIGALIVGVVGGLLWWYLEQKRYNKQVQLKRMVGNNQGKYVFDLAKTWTDAMGVQRWRLKKLGITTTVPPDDALGITLNGTNIAFGVIDSNNQVTWLADKFDYERYKKDGLKDGRYEPVKTESKANYAYQQHYNKKLRGAGWKENMPFIVGAIALVIMVGAVLMFTPKILEANDQNIQSQAQISAQQAQLLEQVNEMLYIMEEKQKFDNTTAPSEGVPN